MATETSNPNEAPVKETTGEDPLLKYFARKSMKECAADCFTKIDAYYEFLKTSGKHAIWKRSYDAFYRGRIHLGKLQKAGGEDEYTLIKVNHYRNLLIHILVTTTSQRPAYEPRAMNSDYKSQAQTIVAHGVLDYYLREKKLERNLKKAVEHGLVYDEGYISVEWDATLGDGWIENPETKQMEKAGDLDFANYAPYDVIRDYLRDKPQHDWMILRRFVNKYTLAAKFPELASQILSFALGNNIARETRFDKVEYKDTDLIPLFTLYHAKTPAVPNGRFLQFLSPELVLLEGPLQYDAIPLYRLAPDEQDGTPWGYTVGYDLLPIQEAVDALHSTVTTNQSSFGVQNIAMPKGSNMTVETVKGGLNLIEYDNKFGKPEGLNLTNTPPEIFKYIEYLEKLMEVISGVNSVARGNPEKSLESGAALALVAAQALQFNTGLQQSYAQLLEDVGTAVVNVLKNYAKAPRLINIAGKANRPLMAEFKGEQIGAINRVSVDMGNPLSRTTAGKIQIADSLLNAQMIKDPEQYIQVATTGRLEPLIEGQQAQLMLIRAENEALADGGQVPALITDDHVLHIKEHQVVLASPEARGNPKVVEAATAHLQQHIQLLMTGDPILLGFLGQPSLAAPTVPGDPSGNGKPDGKTASVKEPKAGMAGTAKQPSMPKNPLTGDEYDPQAG